MILNILVTLAIIGMLYAIIIKMNFDTSMRSKEVPPEFKGNPSPAAVFQKSKAMVSAINESAKEHNKDLDDALGR